MGRKERECGQMGVMRKHGTWGWTMDPPAESWAGEVRVCDELPSEEGEHKESKFANIHLHYTRCCRWGKR